MALVLNASAETQVFRVHGNTFSMKAGQIKSFQDNIADFIGKERKELGLVILPAELEDLDYRQSPEGISLLEKHRKEGVDNRVKCLRQVIYNNQVSLKRDLEMANIKADPKVFASDGEIAAYEEMAKYQRQLEDAEQAKLDRIKELERKIKPLG